MGLPSDNRHLLERVPRRVKLAVGVLWQASEYAQLTDTDRWEFAVEMRELRDLGLSPNDLRALVQMRLVEHASEVTIRGQNGRQFQPTGNLTFSKRTCFVLTDEGVAAARHSCSELAEGSAPCVATHAFAAEPASGPRIPMWDADKRLLCYGGRLVKRFKWHALNQEKILAAFQEEGWPSRIDDPLPPQHEQDSKRRLSDTIKCLNRKQTNHLLMFRGDGSGQGVVWESVEQKSSNGKHV